MNLVEIALVDLSGAETFPLDALMTLRQKWVDARDPLLAALETYASGADRSDENASKAFFGLHLLAEKRDTAAFAPLVAVALEGDHLYDLLGDATTETLPSLLISLCGGDFVTLQNIVETPAADEWARVAAIEAFAWFVHTGDIPLATARATFANWFETLEPRETHTVWYGLQAGVALLGLGDLEPLVARAFRQKLVDASILTFEDFQEDLRAARADRDGFFKERGLGPIEDAVAALEVFDLDEDDLEPPPPAENKFRNVGRNDPCPCGSGKKYKKCCLGASGSGSE
ncbi:hypothetical protein CCR94_03785 [Rhodoblastus sphagnicola]|uniref:Zinc chelation protein SecC n=1 Tax=Rhodoblastus sphagnicola TaxID=333368 RepID=A0A2S6NDU7_9HYPH|nr:DUF1186 domain-containing protein [Rhodoblastus sphagnicola]MBB4198513.1 hypothetical protein [Rhodoblastus sphagnicola]PPQ32770.1 hypothetical protein CCR94_03785 [Rhodoblastus sphagnicola]